jgi:hypothetical protein
MSKREQWAYVLGAVLIGGGVLSASSAPERRIQLHLSLLLVAIGAVWILLSIPLAPALPTTHTDQKSNPDPTEEP